MKILYLHGLESKLSETKRGILQNYGTVIAPDIDYYSDPKIFVFILNLSKEHTFDVVIGSSMGGFMGYYFANTVSIAALLFNPALPHRSVEQQIPELDLLQASPLLHLALGGQDTVMEANGNLNWIASNRIPITDFKIALYNKMEHQIPLEIFEKEVRNFFKQLSDVD